MGAVERGGKVVALHVAAGDMLNAAHIAQTHVLPSSMIYTDEFGIYEQFDGTFYRTHERVKHSASVYVSGDVHTQTIEGFWSLVKRGIARRRTTRFLRSGSSRTLTSTRGATTTATMRGRSLRRYCCLLRRVTDCRPFFGFGGGGAFATCSRSPSTSPHVGTGILCPFGVYCS